MTSGFDETPTAFTAPPPPPAAPQGWHRGADDILPGGKGKAPKPAKAPKAPQAAAEPAPPAPEGEPAADAPKKGLKLRRK